MVAVKDESDTTVATNERKEEAWMLPENNYALRFPFKPLHWVTGLETAYKIRVDGLQGRLVDEKPYLVVQVQPFSTEQEALAYLPRLWGALACLSVELRTGFIAETSVDSVTYAEDPIAVAANLEQSLGIPNKGPVHGIANGHLPSVIPIGKNIRMGKVGEPTISVTLPAEKYAPAFEKALRQPNIETLYSDAKLRTAIELLSDTQRANSMKSKFLTCIIALEVLTEPIEKHAVAQSLLDDLDARIKQQLPSYAKDSDEHHALESLQRELIFRREASVRSSIRQLILDGLNDLSESARNARSTEVVKAYDLRSRLVHDGTVPPTDLVRAYKVAYQTLLDLLARKIVIVQS